MSEFCKHCGAGLGKFRRVGEGTCPDCEDNVTDAQKAAAEIYEWLEKTGRLKFPRDELEEIAVTAIIGRLIDKHLC